MSDKIDFVCPRCGSRGYIKDGATTVITAAAEVGNYTLADKRNDEIERLQFTLAEYKKAAEVGEQNLGALTSDEWKTTCDDIFKNLERFGYKPDGTSFAENGEALLKKSAQWRLRQENQKPVSMEEVEWALMEALVYQGWCRVWRGDGLSCAAQMVWAQHQRAEKIAAATIERCAQVVQKYIEDLTDPKSELMSHWDQIRQQCENYKGSDLPRLNFESLIETIAENAAAAIRGLRNQP